MKAGIQAKLIGFTLLISVVTSGLIASYALHSQNKEYLADLEIRGRSMAAILAQTLIGPVYQLRVDEIARQLAAVTQDAEVSAVYALDRQGLVLSTGQDSENELKFNFSLPRLVTVLAELRQAPATHIQLVDRQMLVTQPIQSADGTVLGFVHLQLTLEQVIRAGRQASAALLIIALAALLLGAVLAFILARHYSVKIRALLAGTQRIANGRLDAPVPVEGADELSHLAEGINHMAQQLDMHHRQLESLVQARTAELAEAKDAAEAASRAKSEFLASMSHELRTPLNAILGFAQLFEVDPELPASARSQAGEIYRAGTHLLGLVNDLIDLARIEAGRLQLSLEPVPVKSVVTESLALVAPLAAQHGVALSQKLDGGETLQVMADYARLRQVLLNLLSNAIKYNRPQGSVTLQCQARGTLLRLSVVDTGLGIAPAQQARLFSAFDRLGKERSNVEGTGIGLVITRRIVEAMQGQIGFESVEGQGSTFWIEFPICEPLAIPAVQADSPPPRAEPRRPAAPRKILYIEDNPMNMRLMQKIFLSRVDLELETAPTAELGLAQARNAPPALILMDINLPGMNGYEALSQLQADARTAHIPVIAISANAMSGDRERGFKAGFVAYVTKPLDVNAFYETLDSVLAAALSPATQAVNF